MIQEIEALHIEVGDQIKLDGADGRPVWKRVTGHFLDGNGRVNIEVGLNHPYVIRRRLEKVMVNRA